MPRAERQESREVGRLLEVETPESVVVRYPLAGLGSRGLAALIDITVLSLLILAEALVVYLLFLLLARFVPEPPPWLVTWSVALLLVMAFVTYWGYYTVGEVLQNGRTFGKRRMHIRVVRDDGSRVGLADSLIRNFLRAVDILPGTYAVGIVTCLLSAQGKRLGDMAAGTVVVLEPDTEEFGVGPGAGDGRVDLVVEFLRRRGQLTEAARYQVGVSLLGMYGEGPGDWDEPTIAGRLADLADVRELAEEG